MRNELLYKYQERRYVMEDMVSVISTVGFPIFCVLALGLFIYKAFQTITAANAEREKTLYATINQIREQLNKSTEINASFVEILSDFRTDISKIQSDLAEIKSEIKED